MAQRWYVVHAYSGYENKVKKSLGEYIERASLQDKFGDILVPSEEV
ncbi:transcription termination/antitermination NusG family protein, partial [Hydrogenovibrio marinus]